MTKPRIRIDRDGWVRNDQPFPYKHSSVVFVRYADGFETKLQSRAHLFDWGRDKNHRLHISHWRFA